METENGPEILETRRSHVRVAVLDDTYATAKHRAALLCLAVQRTSCCAFEMPRYAVRPELFSRRVDLLTGTDGLMQVILALTACACMVLIGVMPLPLYVLWL